MKTLKLFGCLFAALLLHTSLVNAQEKATPSIAGIWQQIRVVMNNGVVSRMPTTFFKILNTDGSFVNLQAQLSNAWLSHQGTYEITGDSTYTEALTAAYLQEWESQESEMRWWLSDDGKMLYTKYKDRKTEIWIPEAWIRIVTPKAINSSPTPREGISL